MDDGYVVRARIVVDDASSPGARSAEANLQHVEDKGYRVGVSITSSLQRMFAMIGGATGLGMAARSITQLHAAVEDATVGMASLLSANGVADFNGSLGIARGLVQGLRDDAAKGVGELSDYQQGLQTILTPGMQAGGSLQQLRELNRLVIAGGYAMRGEEGMRYASMDVMQALTRGASATETPIVNAALSAAGVSTEKFNAEDRHAKLVTLMEAFGKFGPAVEAMGKTWNAQMSTFKDNTKSVLMDITKPIFDRWAEGLSKVNGWLSDHKDTLREITDVWGSRLVALWDHLVRQAGTYAALVGAAAVVGETGMLKGAGGAIMGAAGTVATRAAGNAEFAGMFGAGTGGKMLAGLSGGAETIFGPLVQVLGKVAGPLAIVTTLFLAVKGAMSEYGESLLWVQDRLSGLWGSLSMLGEAFGTLTGKGSALNMIGALVIYTFGGLVGMMSLLVDVTTALVTGLGVMFKVIGEGLKLIWYGENRDLIGMTRSASNMYKALEEGRDTFSRLQWGNPNYSNGSKGSDAILQARLNEINSLDVSKWGPNAVNKAGDVTINGGVHVTQNIKTEAPAEVITKAFDDLIARTYAYRSGARRLPVPTF